MNVRKLTAGLTTLAAVMGLGEFGSAIIIRVENYPNSFAPGAVVFGALFLVGAWLLRNSRVAAGTILLGALCLFEVVEFPGWARHSVLDAVYQSCFAVISLVGLGVAIASLVARRRSPALTS
jgi:hypothetical protein